MLKLEQVNFLIELCGVNGVSVPIKAARLAAETYESLEKMKSDLEKEKPIAAPREP